MRKPIIGVMGAGENASETDMTYALLLGELIAQEGWIVLSGGRDVGVMKAVNQGAKQIPGSLTIGILPNTTSLVSPDVDIAIYTDLGNARNNINILSSHVVVACGIGGAGTVSEIALALKAGKPVILLNADLVSLTFFQKLGQEKIEFAQSPVEVIQLIKSELFVN